MEIRHLAFFVFTAEDLEDGFLYDFRKPDEAFLIMDNDGYRLEREAEKLVRSREKAGIPVARLFYEMTEQGPRRFIPYSLREATVVKGGVEQLQKLMRGIIKHINEDRSRLSGYHCGVFRWGEELLWMHFTETAAVAAVLADELGLKSHRAGSGSISWRKHLSANVLLNKPAPTPKKKTR